MARYGNEKDSPNLIKKISSGRSLVSFMGPKMSFDSVILEFVEFDSRTFKKLKEVDIYFTLDEMLGFCELIKDRTVLRCVKNDLASMKERGLKYSDNTNLFHRIGGGEEEGWDGDRKIKKLKYREFYIQASSNDTYSNGLVFVAMKCDGYKDKNGLVNPKQGFPNREKVIVPMEYETLFNTACLVQSRITAFLVAKQLSGAFGGAQKPEFEQKDAKTPEYASEGTEALYEPQRGCETYPEYAPDPQAYAGVPEIDPEQAFFDAYNAQYAS